MRKGPRKGEEAGEDQRSCSRREANRRAKCRLCVVESIVLVVVCDLLRCVRGRLERCGVVVVTETMYRSRIVCFEHETT